MPLFPVALYGLEVAPGDDLTAAAQDFPATIRITMAAVDPNEDLKSNNPPNFLATLKIVREHHDEDYEDSNEYMQSLLAGSDSEDREVESEDDESEEDDMNGGPSDLSKLKKAKKAAAVKELMKSIAEDDSDEKLEDAPDGLKADKKGKAKASSDDEEGSESSSDQVSEMEEFVVCTLDAQKNYQQSLDITIGENEHVYFKACGNYTIYLTGNYLIPDDLARNGSHDIDDSDDDSAYDLTPIKDELELELDEESDELDDLNTPRITELDNSEDDQVPQLTKIVEKTKNKNKRLADEINDEDSLEGMMAKSMKPGSTEGSKLSKKQLKKLKKNNGEATVLKGVDSKKDDKEKSKKQADEKAKKKDADNNDKKVQFAKNLEQGPTGSTDKGKTDQTSNNKKATLGIKTIDGVKIDDKKIGSGRACKKGDKVSMRYIGKLPNGSVFDSNKKGTPFSFKLGTGEVIRGWDIGVTGMSSGGERRITVPPNKGYGNKAMPGIPANSTLIFDIKMLEVNYNHNLNMIHMHSKPALHHSSLYGDLESIESRRSNRILQSLNDNDLQPPKFHRQRLKFMSILRTLGSSVSNTSISDPTTISQPISPSAQGRFLSPALLKSQFESTVVHRTKFKKRPSIMSTENSMNELLQENSPSTSVGSSNNIGGRLAVLPIASKFSGKNMLLKSRISQRSNDSPYLNFKKMKLLTKSIAVEGNSTKKSPSPISGYFNVEAPLHGHSPTIITVEKVASVKIFLECHYNELASSNLTQRSIRRRYLEKLLCLNQNLTSLEKDEVLQSLARNESDHLRYARVMKSRKKNEIVKYDVASSMYEVIKVIGKGSFGVVRLVREIFDGLNDFQPNLNQPGQRREIYAMKVIRKSRMLNESQEGHLHAERDFFVAAEGSRWVVPLFASFQDTLNLYLVMEYMPGGDFLGLLIRENILNEPVTKWYIAEMILCIEEIHNLHWIHRDIKPDNFLISASGHLKISDFGLAFDGHWSHDQSYFNNHRYSLLTKLGLNVEGDTLDQKEGKTVAAGINISQVMMDEQERHELDYSESIGYNGLLDWRNKHGQRSHARSVVGTSQYMAPEVVRGELYDARCDWWSLAVILYECLYGHTPFLAEEGGRHKTKLNIISFKSVFRFPQRPIVSRQCQDLIWGIIQEKEIRLCSKRYHNLEQSGYDKHVKYCSGRYVYPNDAEDIKAHKWFRDIPWDRLHLMVPPIVPRLQSPEDTRYFEDEESISDFSEPFNEVPHTEDYINKALRPFNPNVQKLIQDNLRLPYDSVRIRNVENEIDNFVMAEDHKQYLKAIIKVYGRKEMKRPRDKILRDEAVGAKVLELRKEGAFLGYTYRRFRPRAQIFRGSFRPSSS